MLVEKFPWMFSADDWSDLTTFSAAGVCNPGGYGYHADHAEDLGPPRGREREHAGDENQARDEPVTAVEDRHRETR